MVNKVKNEHGTKDIILAPMSESMRNACEKDPDLGTFIHHKLQRYHHAAQSSPAGELLARLSDAAIGSAKPQIVEAIAMSKPSVVWRAHGFMVAPATHVVGDDYLTALHCLNGTKTTPLGDLKVDEQIFFLAMTEPQTSCTDGIIFLSTDSSKQLQLLQVAGGSKVTVVGATSRGGLGCMGVYTIVVHTC